MFSSRRSSFGCPGWARSTASGPAARRARSGRGSPSSVRDLAEQIDQGLIRFPRLRREARDDVAEVGTVERRVLVDLPREEALAQRAVGNEADPEFLEGRQHFRFRVSPPQRVFALDRRDRLDRVRATDRLRSCFGKAEVLDLAFLNQVLHRSRHVFDRHVRVDTVLVEQIDGVDLEPLERGLGDLLDVLRPAIQAEPRVPRWDRSSKPNLVAITTCPRKGARASPTSSSFVNGP